MWVIKLLDWGFETQCSASNIFDEHPFMWQYIWLFFCTAFIPRRGKIIEGIIVKQLVIWRIVCFCGAAQQIAKSYTQSSISCWSCEKLKFPFRSGKRSINTALSGFENEALVFNPLTTNLSGGALLNGYISSIILMILSASGFFSPLCGGFIATLMQMRCVYMQMAHILTLWSQYFRSIIILARYNLRCLL